MSEGNPVYDPRVLSLLHESIEHLSSSDKEKVIKQYIALLSSKVSSDKPAQPKPESPQTKATRKSVLFSDSADFDDRFVPDFAKLGEYIAALKSLGTKIVLTSGTFDLFHIGHARYVAQAREHGDFLVVGVDSDAKVRERKGPNRPLVPEDERMQLLSHIRGVGFVTLKTPEHKKWELIKTVRPDTLIATQETYSDEQIKELEENYCGKVVILPRQAETSTSARIRRFQMNAGGDVAQKALEAIERVLKPLTEFDEYDKA